MVLLQASENGTIQLYKKMQAENLAREAEIAELRDLLAKARAELAGKMDEDKDEMISRLEKENKQLKDKLADEKNCLQVKKRFTVKAAQSKMISLGKY